MDKPTDSDSAGADPEGSAEADPKDAEADPTDAEADPTDAEGSVLPVAKVERSSAGAAKPSARKGRKPVSFGVRVKKRWRAWLRAVHRDVGYLAVGLTVVYALSGLAINHIGSWDPNFSLETESHQVGLPISADEETATKQVLAELGVDAEPRDFFFETDEQLEIFFDDKERTFVVNTATGAVVESYKSERFILRAANWLHYNRGKAAWTYIADGFAIFLLFLALSGIFMIRGRKGLIGRGGLLITLGAAVPILFVHFSGGP